MKWNLLLLVGLILKVLLCWEFLCIDLMLLSVEFLVLYSLLVRMILLLVVCRLKWNWLFFVFFRWNLVVMFSFLFIG